MRVTGVDYDTSSFGITSKSLKMLRDALALAFQYHVLVIQVPVEDICCGFFVYNLDSRRATWTGDGFRTDRGGEGGAGFRSAESLLDIFGLTVWHSDQVDLDELYTTEDPGPWLTKLAQKILDKYAFEDSDYKRAQQLKPNYVRYY